MVIADGSVLTYTQDWGVVGPLPNNDEEGVQGVLVETERGSGVFEPLPNNDEGAQAVKMNLVYSGNYGLGGQEVPEVYKQHPQKAMRELGISYERAVANSLHDCWWFINCSNVPNPLPPFLTVMDYPISDLVGHGLTQQEADQLERKEEQFIASIKAHLPKENIGDLDGPYIDDGLLDNEVVLDGTFSLPLLKAIVAAMEDQAAK